MKFKINQETLMSNQLDDTLMYYVIDKMVLESLLKLCIIEETDIFNVLKSKTLYYTEVFNDEFLTKPCFLVFDDENNLQIWSDEYIPIKENDIYFTDEYECDEEVRIKNSFYQKYKNKICSQLLNADPQVVLELTDVLNLL